MAKVFQIAAINPIRILPEDEADLFAAIQDDRCYPQKWLDTDTTIMQILSDYDVIDAVLRDCTTNAVLKTLTVDLIPVNIIDQTFKCYQIEVPFSGLAAKRVYMELVYNDSITPITPVRYISAPMEIGVVHQSTLLFKYKNSENDFSVIFDTGIEFTLRVEGTIKDFTPASDDVVYNDQRRNATLLNSVPYRTFKLYIGNAAGLPNWITDKVNRAMACDQKLIDGDYYEKIEGAKWEVSRADEYPFSGLTIEIMPVENIFLQRLKTGQNPPEGYTVVELVKNYFNNAASITIGDVFKKYSLLKHVSTINYGAAYTLKIGTTDGGNELGEFEIPAGTGNPDGVPFTDNIDALFVKATPIYLTDLTGTASDVMLDYLQYDALPAQPLPSPAPTLGRGAMIRFKEITPGEFAAAFDLITGLGKVGGGWEGWAISDGRNGTDDEGETVPVGYKQGDPVFGVPGNIVGENEHAITQAELPSFNIPFKYDPANRGNGGQTTMREAPGNGNETYYIPFPGGDQPMSLMQKSIVAIWVVKIAA